MTLRIAVTPGEPAGIGPDLLISLVHNNGIQRNGNQGGYPHELVVIADPDLLMDRAELLGLPLSIRLFDPELPPQALHANELCVASVPLFEPCIPGTLNPVNGAYVLATLDKAISFCRDGTVAAMVTAPVHKGVINEAGIHFTGHTEYLAEHTNTPKVVMMLATEGLRVALVTTHLPLAEVPNAVTQQELTDVIKILHHALVKDFGKANPRILVCGLNPHAGEGGHMGREEIEVIEPVLARFNQQGMQLIGPLPADTLFTPKVLDGADAVLAMYHDQGLPVLKYKGFGEAVNITLGLPIIRTSVDHGTALDLVGTGKANLGSLLTALTTAEEMATARADVTRSDN